jgi:hypothetical protein
MYYNTGSNALLYWNGTAWVGAVSDATKVDKDSVVVAATRVVANKLLSGDTQPAFQIMGDGRHNWGPGGTTATDTNLYRVAVGDLRTDGVFDVMKQITSYQSVSGQISFAALTAPASGFFFFGRLGADAQPTFSILTSGSLAWGPGGSVATDTSLYRNSANSLWTGSEFVIYNNTLRVLGANSGTLLTSAEVGAGHYDFVLGINGSMSWGIATTGTDTNLYRAGAGILNTDGAFNVGKYVFAGAGTATGNWAFLTRVSGDSNNRWDVQNQGLMEWGDGTNSPDTTLYRWYANALYTPGDFGVGGSIRSYASAVVTSFYSTLSADTTSRFSFDSNGSMQWGPGNAAEDVTLARGGVNVLQTNSTFLSNKNVQANYGTANTVNVGWSAGAAAGIEFGSAGDTRIYRSAAGVLKTDGTLNAVGGLQINGVPVVSGGMSNPMTAPWDVIVGSTAGAPTRLALGAAGSSLSSVGSTVTWVSPSFNYWNPGDPAVTTNTAPNMVGLGSSFRITPAKSGRIIVIVSCRAPNVTNTNLFLQLAIGTGTAPANGAAWPPAGTIGTMSNSFNSNQGTPTFIGYYAGAIGTNYWIDLIYSVDSGSTYGGNGPKNLGMFVFEV